MRQKISTIRSLALREGRPLRAGTANKGKVEVSAKVSLVLLSDWCIMLWCILYCRWLRGWESLNRRQLTSLRFSDGAGFYAGESISPKGCPRWWYGTERETERERWTRAEPATQREIVRERARIRLETGQLIVMFIRPKNCPFDGKIINVIFHCRHPPTETPTGLISGLGPWRRVVAPCWVGCRPVPR